MGSSRTRGEEARAVSILQTKDPTPGLVAGLLPQARSDSDTAAPAPAWRGR